MFAILRGANGRRHEVDFNEDPVIGESLDEHGHRPDHHDGRRPRRSHQGPLRHRRPTTRCAGRGNGGGSRSSRPRRRTRAAPRGQQMTFCCDSHKGSNMEHRSAGQPAERIDQNRWRLPEPMGLPRQAPPWYRAPISTRAPTMVIMNGPERLSCAPVGTVIAMAPAQSVLATRKPILLLRLSGWFLLRFAERRFCGLLFQEPPRRTREDGGRSGAGARECEARRRRRYVPPASGMHRVRPVAPVVFRGTTGKNSTRLRRAWTGPSMRPQQIPRIALGYMQLDCPLRMIPHPCLGLGDRQDKSVVELSRRGCRSTRNDDLFARSRSRSG